MKWWEDICTGCGLCCHEKVKVAPRSYVLYLNSRCGFLSDDNKCTVYDERFEKCPSCRKMTLFRAVFASWLPPSCAYVRWAEKHHIRFARRCEWTCELDEL